MHRIIRTKIYVGVKRVINIDTKIILQIKMVPQIIH